MDENENDFDGHNDGDFEDAFGDSDLPEIDDDRDFESDEDGGDDESDEDDDRDSDRDEDSDLIDGVGFADPGGNSSLRAATASNPRNLPCGTCGRPNQLTPIDKRRGYQCDRCADRAEGHGD